MPGLTSSLNIGLSGLQAAQGALSVVGHNIANVNTPNYSRQQATLASNTPQAFGTLEFGTGVSLTNIMGVRDKYLDLQITQATSRQSGAQTRYQGIEGISSVFKDDGTSGLSSLVQKFYAAFSQLAARPEDGSVRTSVVGQAQSLVSGLQSRYQLVADQRTQADKNVAGIVTQVNTLTAQIASLNARIAQETTPGADSDGRDQRQALATQLATLVGVQVFEDNHNQLQISLDSGAAVLVSGNQAYTMSASPGANPPSYNQVSVTMGGTTIDVTAKIKEGSLGANLDLRDNVLASYQTKLDQLAAGLVAQTNLLHQTGFGVGANATTTGVDFFKNAGANGANGLPSGYPKSLAGPPPAPDGNVYWNMVNSMSVNAAVVSDPTLIAASDTASTPGNNAMAKKIAALQTATGTVDTNGDGAGDSGPYSLFISSLVGTIGSDGQGFKAGSTTQDNLISALQTQRDRISGVDMDEEATALLSFQRGYQASAHFISVIDQLTAQLMTQFGT